jgi:hypothetical protein
MPIKDASAILLVAESDTIVWIFSKDRLFYNNRD